MAKSGNQKDHFGIIGLLTVLNSLVIIIFFFSFLNSKQKTQLNIPNIISSSYECSDNKTIQAQFFDSKAEINLSDKRTFLLIQGLSGSGVRYTNSNESVIFWIKGNTAFLEEDSITTYTDCIEED